jgi:hypothetical protein
LALYAVTQHNAPVSSNSPQKELDLSPPNSGLFFRPDLPGVAQPSVPFPNVTIVNLNGRGFRILDINK